VLTQPAPTVRIYHWTTSRLEEPFPAVTSIIPGLTFPGRLGRRSLPAPRRLTEPRARRSEQASTLGPKPWSARLRGFPVPGRCGCIRHLYYRARFSEVKKKQTSKMADVDFCDSVERRRVERENPMVKRAPSRRLGASENMTRDQRLPEEAITSWWCASSTWNCHWPSRASQPFRPWQTSRLWQLSSASQRLRLPRPSVCA